MKNIYMAAITGFATGVFLVTACKKKDDDNNNGNGLDRKPMLENYADNYILPAYQQMKMRMDNLKTSVDAFAAAPDSAKLVAARASWIDAYSDWQRTDMLEFGPATDVSLRTFMNTYPVTVSKVNTNINSGVYDLEEFGNKDAQGFPALDYMLNGTAPSVSGTIAYYTVGATAAARKQYLQDVTNKMVQKVAAVQTAWTSYRNTFVASTGTDANSGFSEMVNAFVLYYERYLRSGKIGLPAGAMTGVAAPNLTEAYYSPSVSKDLALVALNSVRNFYEGKYYNTTAQNGAGMKSYYAAIGTKDNNGNLMSDLISTELGQATTALSNFNGTIENGVQTDRPAVLGIYEELQDVVPLIKVDMISAFGISITYTDNDGD